MLSSSRSFCRVFQMTVFLLRRRAPASWLETFIQLHYDRDDQVTVVFSDIVILFLNKLSQSDFGYTTTRSY